MAVANYYFDGHTTVSDVDSNWVDESNFIDDSAVTSAYALLEGSTSTNYLLVTGTTAPSSGGEILQVRAKLMGSSTEWVVLDVPSTGGWTWAKLQELQTRVYTVDITEFTTHCYASVYAPNGELPPEYIGTTIRESILAFGLEIEVTYTESGTSASLERLIYGAGDAEYSMENSTDLETGVTTLSTAFTTQDYGTVATDDNTFLGLSGGNQYSKFLFKKYNSGENSQNITVIWKGKSTLAPSSSAVYLQIYNQNTSSWETLDSDTSTGSNIEFTLSGSITSNQSNYYDAGYVVSFRIYQEVT